MPRLADLRPSRLNIQAGLRRPHIAVVPRSTRKAPAPRNIPRLPAYLHLGAPVESGQRHPLIERSSKPATAIALVVEKAVGRATQGPVPPCDFPSRHIGSDERR